MDGDALPYDEGDDDEEEEEKGGGRGGGNGPDIFLSLTNLYRSNHHNHRNSNCVSEYQQFWEIYKSGPVMLFLDWG